MRENDFLEIIKSITGDKYIGDDCAYLKDMGLIVSQDSLVEDVHFSLKYMTAYQLGYKSAMVNISDIAASGGSGKYITVALSLPKNISEDFIKEFYNGLKTACDKFNIEIIGGDLTGADKVMISITIIGTDKGRRISSRSGAKCGHVIVTSGEHGSSAGGFELLKNGNGIPEEAKKLINSHLMPEAQVKFGEIISENADEDYGMMDSSDGLADALYKIADASGKTIIIDFEKVSYNKALKQFFPKKYRDMILFGGEDYQIVASVPEKLAKRFNLPIIGYVTERAEDFAVKIINYGDSEKIINNLDECFNHF